MRGREAKGGGVTRRQQLVLARAAALPDRADRMDDVLCRQTIAVRYLGGSGLATAKRPAFGKQIRSGGAMDGAVDAAATEERTVGSIDDMPRPEGW